LKDDILVDEIRQILNILYIIFM